MKRKTRTHFKAEDKKRIVQIVKMDGDASEFLQKKHDITRQLIMTWVKEFDKDGGSNWGRGPSRLQKVEKTETVISPNLFDPSDAQVSRIIVNMILGLSKTLSKGELKELSREIKGRGERYE